MNVLILHAHPEKNSFCSALKDEAANYFRKRGDDVIINDLYSNSVAMEFGGRNDFKSLKNPEHFVYHEEQKHAYEKDLIADNIKAEMDKLEWADLLVLNFPLWWFSFPSVMRNWMERCMVNGFTYAPEKGEYSKRVLAGKAAMCCVTTGGPSFTYAEDGKNGYIDTHLYHINRGLFTYMGMKPLPYYVAWGPHKRTPEEREAYIQAYKQHLDKITSEITV